MIEDDCLQVGILRGLYWYLYGPRGKGKGKRKEKKKDSCRNRKRAELLLRQKYLSSNSGFYTFLYYQQNNKQPPILNVDINKFALGRKETLDLQTE